MKVCWNITSKCNKDCIYCFKFNEYDSTHEENKEILNYLIQNNVDRINWSGGEPFLYSNLTELLAIGKKNEIFNCVNTNASLLNIDNLKEKLSNVDKLIISLDFVDDELNKENGMGVNYYKHLTEILPKIKEFNNKLIIQITTVVFSKNIELLGNIYKELKKYNIDCWKLIRFFPIRGKALDNKNNLSITDNEFDEVRNKFKNAQQDFKINVDDFDETCKQIFIVLSSGKIIKSENGVDKEVISI